MSIDFFFKRVVIFLLSKLLCSLLANGVSLSELIKGCTSERTFSFSCNHCCPKSETMATWTVEFENTFPIFCLEANISRFMVHFMVNFSKRTEHTGKVEMPFLCSHELQETFTLSFAKKKLHEVNYML